ncbi:membrane protein insertion efficiency factor YidD [Candidatus Babeliales bacterium]|nr:membrane protein insertion efficiency factor YidD [Candidatus Babeliales bacterium]
MIKKIIINIINSIIDSIRPLLGPSGCCIYTISCRQYTKIILQQKPFYLSIPLIIIRIISCNPITAIFIKIKNYFIH